MINVRPELIVPGDKGFLTPEGWKFFYAHGFCKTIQDAQHLLGLLTVETIDVPRQRIKLVGIDKTCGIQDFIKQRAPDEKDGNLISVIPDLTFKGVNALDMSRKPVKTIQPLVIGRMPMGTKSGASTVFIVAEHPGTGETIISETSMKLFLDVADQMRKFDNPTGN